MGRGHGRVWSALRVTSPFLARWRRCSVDHRGGAVGRWRGAQAGGVRRGAGARAPVRRRWPEDVEDADHILVVEVAQNLDFAQRALRIRQVLKRLGDLLDRNLIPSLVVNRRAHHAIRAVAERFHQRVARVDVKARAAHHEAADPAVRRGTGVHRRRNAVHCVIPDASAAEVFITVKPEITVLSQNSHFLCGSSLLFGLTRTTLGSTVYVPK